MTKRMLTFAGAVVLACGSLQSASAQSVFNPPSSRQAPYTRPALSPYLNLLRGGDPAANYYLGVLTEQDRRYQLSNPPIAAQIPYLDTYVDDRVDADLRDRQLLPTGHTAGFMIYNNYYRIPNQRSFIPYNPNAGGGAGGNPGVGRPLR
jgi:hypothetical protein